MPELDQFGDLKVSFVEPHVALCEIQRPPNNFFNVALINSIADAYEHLDGNKNCRAIVLASEGKNFCAGADFSSSVTQPAPTPQTGNPLYEAAVRVFSVKKPVVAAVQGAAIGGGFGLAMSAAFRVGSAASRFSANFVKLGFSPGFGLTHTLPRIIGEQSALEVFLSGQRIKGQEAFDLGILDRFVEDDLVRKTAIEFASSFAKNAPLAVQDVLAALRKDIAEKVRIATDREFQSQYTLQQTRDFQEGIRAVSERRPGNFTGE